MSLEDLHIYVEERLAAVCSALEELKLQQQCLAENADKLKSCVKESVNGHVKNLRNREKQIIRQIEVITAHQKSILEIQIAKAFHTKGSINATKNILARCEPEDVTTLSKVRDGRIPTMHSIQPLKLASLQLDGKALTSEIIEFAKVCIPDTITHQHSDVLPAEMEDYEDSGHEVLHKSLRGSSNVNSVSDSPVKISVCFPKLPNSSWLAYSSPKIGVTEETRSMSSDISSWLSKLVQSPEDERNGPFVNKENAADGFELIKMRDSECSSSIEVLNHPTSEDLCGFAGSVESMEDNTRWLKRSTRERSTPSVASACQANEVCNSFNDCLCNNYCKKSALDKALQSATWLQKTRPRETGSQPSNKVQLATKEVLAHMASIWDSDSSKWLLKTPPKTPLHSHSSYKRVLYNPTTNAWLRNAVDTTTTEVKIGSSSNVWLLRKLKEIKDQNRDRKKCLNQENSEIKNTSSPSTISVTNLKNALEELEDLLPKYPLVRDSTSSSVSSGDTNHERSRKRKWLSTLHRGERPILPASVLDMAETDLNIWLVNNL